MYAESIVKQRIAFMEEDLGFKLEYHSTEEVDRFTAILTRDEVKNEAGDVIITRNLTKSEAQFIANERALCTCDAAYFMTRYAYLSDETNTKVRFKFRDSQKIYFHVISELEAQLRAIELLCAKGRQQFITTVTEILDGHRVLFYRDVTCFTASADRDKSAEMMLKVLFMYDNMPWWLKPKYTRRVENVPGILELGSLNSRMRVVHGSGSAKTKGGQKSGIARGTTPTVYHLSEVSDFPDPEQQIEAAIFRSVHASPKVFGVLESTFSGDTGWFPNKYKFAKEQLRTGRVSRLYPLFFSFPCNRDLYPTRTWIRTNPIQGWRDYHLADKVEEQILKAELFIRNSPLLATYFGRDWRMPEDQKWYYYCQYFEHERTGAMSTLMQEMPCDDIEAMQSAYDNVFGRDTINICHENKDKQFEVYSIVGTGIDSKFDPDPDDIDYTKDRTLLTHFAPKDQHRYEWELIPLKSSIFDEIYDPSLDPDRRNELIKSMLPLADAKLFIYPDSLRPDTLETSLGVDTSNGISADSSVIAGATKGNGLVPDMQIAEFRSEYVNHVEAYAFAFPIALYLRRLNRNQDHDLLKWPWCGIEQIAAIGDTCQVQLRRMGYPTGRFFRFGRYDGVELNKKSSQKVGWYTVRWSRDLLIGYMVHAVKNGWYKINSPWTIDECRSFEVHETSTGKAKLEHSSIAHDDGLFGNAIATFINHDLDTLAERGNKHLIPRKEDDPPEVVFGSSRGYIINPNASNSRISIDELNKYRY